MLRSEDVAALGDMETSLLNLGSSLQLPDGHELVPAGGSTAWIPAHLRANSRNSSGAQLLMAQGGGPFSLGRPISFRKSIADMELGPLPEGEGGLPMTASGLDNMESIQEALPNIGSEYAHHLATTAAHASAQHHHQHHAYAAHQHS